MPSRHVLKNYKPNTFYHIYNHGVDRKDVFKDEQDFNMFLSLITRYLDSAENKDKYGRKYPDFAKSIEVNAYTLMSNHFHLLIYQSDERAISDLMRSLLTSYTMYFNQRHKHQGSIFQGRYHAVDITETEYLPHISRYIHLAPVDYRAYPYTSYDYYIGKKKVDWLHPEKVMKHYRDSRSYTSFVGDIKDYRSSLDTIKPMLANY